LRKCAAPINVPPATLTDAEVRALPIANKTRHSGRWWLLHHERERFAIPNTNADKTNPFSTGSESKWMKLDAVVIARRTGKQMQCNPQAAATNMAMRSIRGELSFVFKADWGGSHPMITEMRLMS
jgi:hypothetical protein